MSNDTWRPSSDEVARIKGPSVMRENNTRAELSATKLRSLLETEDYVHAMGAVTGNQAMQMVKAGMKAIYLSGWQVAADANDSLTMYPDQSLYSVSSGPMLANRINNAFTRSAQIDHLERQDHNNSIPPDDESSKWLCPIIADAEAGFGGALNAYELMTAYIKAGVAGVHFEDQLSSAKKCGHLGGKVLVPASEFIKKLKAARLAAEVCGTDTVIVARTDADSAKLLTSDIDESDHEFIEKTTTGEGQENETTHFERTPDGFYRITGGVDMAIRRGLQYAPYADLLWCETSRPDIDAARKFAESIHAQFPGKMLAYNCSPSFNWGKHLDDETIAKFQRELGAMGYKFQFITLAGFHQLNKGMFELAKDYQERDMTAYAELQKGEFELEIHGYTATKHQREVGVPVFDAIAQAIDKDTSTLAEAGSTEEEQF